MREEIEEFWNSVPQPSNLIVGIDFNTTVYPNHVPNTGPFTHPPLESHKQISRIRMQDFLTQFGLKVPHSFTDHEEHWTREQKGVKSQIDYILIPVGAIVSDT